MLKYFDQSGDFVRMISEIEYTDLQIVRTLSNGDKTLSFTYQGKYTDMSLEGYIETDSDIYVIKEIMPKSGAADYKCQLDIEPLEAGTIRQFTAKDKTIQQAANAALIGTGWTCSVGSSISSKVRSVQQFNKTPFEILLKIRDAFMCEVKFDSKNKVVSFAEQYGSDRGVYLRPELNLVDISLTLDSYEFYTRIIPIGADGLDIKSVNSGVEYVENYQYSSKIRTLYWEDTNYTDAQALKDDAVGKLADLSKPKRSYSASVRDLAKLSAEYDILDYDIGDTVTIIDEPSGIRDKQRIVSITEYPEQPERNTVELSNTVLTWEEYQARLEAAANAWEDVSNADGSINGVYVHGVQADDVVKVQVDVNGQTVERNLNQAVGIVQNDIDSVNIRVGTVETTYLQATMANIDTANINTAKIKDLFVQVGLIRDAVIDGARITGYLDAVTVNAASITAGTLVADRIAIRGDTTALVYALNNYGQITSQEVDTLDGYILTDRTVNADKIVAHSITANELTVNNIVGTNGWINLAQGTFNYGGTLIWDGTDLDVGPYTIGTKGFTYDNVTYAAQIFWDTAVFKHRFRGMSTAPANYDNICTVDSAIITVEKRVTNQSGQLDYIASSASISSSAISVFGATNSSPTPQTTINAGKISFKGIANVTNAQVGLYDSDNSEWILSYKNRQITAHGYFNVEQTYPQGEAQVNIKSYTRNCRVVATTGSSSRFGLYDIDASSWVIVSEIDNKVNIPNILHTRNYGSGATLPVLLGTMDNLYQIYYMSTSSSGLWINAQWGASSFTSRGISVPASDARLKANITSATKSALDVVKALKVRQFDWKDGHGHWDFGLIAQEAREIDSNIVIGEEAENQYLSMDTLYLVDILTKAIQELADKVARIGG